MQTDQFHFFWEGPFSQWEMADFTSDGIKFNCAEQFMMYNKALFFNDLETAEKIMLSKSPKEQKAYGRIVDGFSVDEWVKVAKHIVYLGNYYKFSQNRKLYDTLMATHPLVLVEASPHDKIWGIGLRENDPRALDKSTWLGKNWLGQVLTGLREDFRNSLLR